MSTIWRLAGRISFWLLWPALFVYAPLTKRTRIIVSADNKVLVVRGWLSSGRWNLPGGGVLWREGAAEGAARELKEETGIDVKAGRLTPVTIRRSVESGLIFTEARYALELPAPVNVRRQAGELLEARWMDRVELIKSSRVSRNTKSSVRSWCKV